MEDLLRLTASGPGTIEAPETEATDVDGSGDGWMVTVFNNEYNTYDEVMEILMIATGCSPDEAYIETWEIDHMGKSNVHFAGQEECHNVAAVIAQIGIRVEVTREE